MKKGNWQNSFILYLLPNESGRTRGQKKELWKRLVLELISQKRFGYFTIAGWAKKEKTISRAKNENGKKDYFLLLLNMTVCYPLTRQTDYTELRYSLRSIERFLAPPYEIVIVGDYLPGWVTNVTQIGLGDIPGRKQLSIRRKILAALEYSKKIFFLNDDVYLLKPTDPETYPYYSSGESKESGAKPLFDQLRALGKPVKHFEGHQPLVYDQRFKEVAKHFTEDTIIKSMYCNYLEIEGTDLPDIKIHKKIDQEVIRNKINGYPYFSTGPGGVQSALPVLQELFPKPSKHEI